MNIERTKSSIVAKLVFGSLLGAMIVLPGTASAKQPFTAEEVAKQNEAFMASVRKGYELWHSDKLGTNGLACGNCHPDASATNPESWPKYQSNLSKVSTMREMFNWCIAVPLMGKTLAYDSDEMVAMEAYATFMSRGFAIAPGKDAQTAGRPVISGPGFPTGNDGNR
jgi:thiosulfate dehydrogenase